MSNMFETALEKTVERLQLAAKAIPRSAGGNGHYALSEVNGAISCLNNTLDWLSTGPWYENQHLFDLRQIQAQAANGPLSRLETAEALAKLIERIEKGLDKAPSLPALEGHASATLYFALKRAITQCHKDQGRVPIEHDVDQLTRAVALTVYNHTHPAKDTAAATRGAAPAGEELGNLSGAAVLAKAREAADNSSSALWADWEQLARAANAGAGRTWLKFTLTPEGEPELKAIPESELYLDPTAKPDYAQLVNAIDQTVRNIKVAQGDGTEAPFLIHLENLLGIESTYFCQLVPAQT